MAMGGAPGKEQDSGSEGQDIQLEILMAMGLSKRNKTLAGRVRMSNRGC